MLPATRKGDTEKPAASGAFEAIYRGWSSCSAEARVYIEVAY
jgi:hypothetical protein